MFSLPTTETTCFSLNDHGRSATKDVSTFYAMKSNTPEKPVSHLPPPPAPCRSLAKQGRDIQGYFIFLAAQAPKLNFWMLLPPQPNAVKTARLHLHNENQSLPVRRYPYPIVTLWSMAYLLLLKWYFGKCWQRPSRRGFLSFFHCFFFLNCRLFRKLKSLPLPTFFFHF